MYNKPADDFVVDNVDEQPDDGKVLNPLPDNNRIVNLAESDEPSATVNNNANGRGGPTFVTPRTGLHIKVEEDEYQYQDDGLRNAEMAEQVDNPYLLHYKNKSQVLKQEVMGQQNMPITPNQEGQRDPEEEFFMLAVLAHKMLHNEYYDDAEYVYQISAA